MLVLNTFAECPFYYHMFAFTVKTLSTFLYIGLESHIITWKDVE